MNRSERPTLEEFLVAPEAEVAEVAPTTMIYAPAGTRRHALFEGIEPLSEQYVQWARAASMRCFDLIFRHGVRHLITLAFAPKTLRETHQYQAQFVQRVDWALAGPESLADYQHLDCRVRFIGVDSMPEFQATVERLRTATATQSERTLYWYSIPHEDTPWNELFRLAQQTEVRTRADAIRALYGEDIPPASLYLCFGKPIISTEFAPPLLLGHAQGYWTQQAGYRLTERELRTIFYDYAYLRTTWYPEKLERNRQALAYRRAWEEGPTLGLGMPLGPFWYPAPMSSPAWTRTETE